VFTPVQKTGEVGFEQFTAETSVRQIPVAQEMYLPVEE
jgi:hypothetical protein